jgi:hypothetical protein
LTGTLILLARNLEAEREKKQIADSNLHFILSDSTLNKLDMMDGYKPCTANGGHTSDLGPYDGPKERGILISLKPGALDHVPAGTNSAFTFSPEVNTKAKDEPKDDDNHPLKPSMAIQDFYPFQSLFKGTFAPAASENNALEERFHGRTGSNDYHHYIKDEHLETHGSPPRDEEYIPAEFYGDDKREYESKGFYAEREHGDSCGRPRHGQRRKSIQDKGIQWA